MSAEVATGDLGDPYHSLILRGLAIREAGYAARRADILALHVQGLKPPAISRELQRRAREAGCSEREIRCLGVSEHNVRLVLRGTARAARRVAEGGSLSV